MPRSWCSSRAVSPGVSWPERTPCPIRCCWSALRWLMFQSFFPGVGVCAAIRAGTARMAAKAIFDMFFMVFLLCVRLRLTACVMRLTLKETQHAEIGCAGAKKETRVELQRRASEQSSMLARFENSALTESLLSYLRRSAAAKSLRAQRAAVPA